MSNLKPCAHCGSVYTQVRWIGFTHTHNGAFEAGYRDECLKCGVITRACRTEAEAIEAWNTRTYPEGKVMLMGDNEKRRQVAAKLREARENLEDIPVPTTVGEQSFIYLQALAIVLGGGDIFSRLADLIDPASE